MNAYIEIQGSFRTQRLWEWELRPQDLRAIGEFTRENIQKWVEWRFVDPPNRHYADLLVDFHAVCGEIDIPWRSEQSKRIWDTSRE